MRLVDPVKLDSLREMIDGDIAAICVKLEVSRSEAYKKLFEEMGLCVHINGCCQWASGFIHLRGTPNPIYSFDKETKDRSDALQRYISTEVTPILESESPSPDTHKTKSVLLYALKESADLLQHVTERPSRELFRRSVFGVSRDAVLIALLLEHLQPEVDIWLSGDRFQDLYPKSAWSEMLQCVHAPFGNLDTQDKNQLYLFEDIECDEMSVRAQHTAFVQERDRYISLGPLLALQPRNSIN